MAPELATIVPASAPVFPAAAPAAAPVAVPRLSVVVVNYLHWDDTAALVRQLRASPAVQTGEAEVVVVDNHSPYHPIVRRLRRLEGVSLRRWRKNHGFARAVNEGCRLARGDWLLLLNPDMTLASDFPAAALEHAEALHRADPTCGIIGFGLCDPDGRPQASAGPFPTLPGALARLLLPRRRRKYYLRDAAVARPVDWVTGCCLLVRRDCWAQLRGLDASFFLYYEDVDLCRRARACGWSVWLDPTLTALHHNPLHGRPVPPHLRLITRHALLTYAAKHWPGWQARLLAGIVRLEAWLRKRHARNRRDEDTAETYRALGVMARDLAAGRTMAARIRLLRVVRRRDEEARRATLRRHSQP